MAKIKRSQVQSFLQTASSPSIVLLSLIGSGVTTGTINYNPETSSETYIHEEGATIDVERYAPNLPVEASCVNGDAVFELSTICARPAQHWIMLALILSMCGCTETPTSTDKYPAERQEVSIQIDSFGGDGGVATKINYTINFIGDPVVASTTCQTAHLLRTNRINLPAQKWAGMRFMTQSLTIDTGVIRLAINGDELRVIAFNPNDALLLRSFTRCLAPCKHALLSIK